MEFVVFLLLIVAYVIADVRNERACRRAVAEWNANRPDDDPRRAQMY